VPIEHFAFFAFFAFFHSTPINHRYTPIHTDAAPSRLSTASLSSHDEKEQRAFRAQLSAINAAIQTLKDEARAAGRSLTPQEEAHIRETHEHRDFIKDNFPDIIGAQRYDKEVNQRR